MKKGWLIYPDTRCNMDAQSYEWMREEARQQGLAIEILLVEELSVVIDNGFRFLKSGKELPAADFAMVRGYAFEVMRQIEAAGIRLFNTSSAMQTSLNKTFTHQVLAQKGIPTPKTIAGCRDYDTLSAFFAGQPFVAKYSCGNRGKEVFLIENREQFNTVAAQFDSLIAQQYIAHSRGKDIRVWVVGGQAVAAVLRHNEHSFKSNFSLGGKAEVVELTEEIARLASESALAVGLDFAGVDLLFSPDGFTVCEVNGNAAFRSLSQTTDTNPIPQALFRYIAAQIR